MHVLPRSHSKSSSLGSSGDRKGYIRCGNATAPDSSKQSHSQKLSQLLGYLLCSVCIKSVYTQLVAYFLTRHFFNLIRKLCARVFVIKVILSWHCVLCSMDCTNKQDNNLNEVKIFLFAFFYLLIYCTILLSKNFLLRIFAFSIVLCQIKPSHSESANIFEIGPSFLFFFLFFESIFFQNCPSKKSKPDISPDFLGFLGFFFKAIRLRFAWPAKR